MLKKGIFLFCFLLVPSAALAECTSVCDAQGLCRMDCPSTNPNVPPAPPSTLGTNRNLNVPNIPRLPRRVPRRVQTMPMLFTFQCHTQAGICTFTLPHQLQLGTSCYCDNGLGQRWNGAVLR